MASQLVHGGAWADWDARRALCNMHTPGTPGMCYAVRARRV